ncbi:MAG: hypothetical protein RSD19_08120, partial [Oscillospiraceae bacterium]
MTRRTNRKKQNPVGFNFEAESADQVGVLPQLEKRVKRVKAEGEEQEALTWRNSLLVAVPPHEASVFDDEFEGEAREHHAAVAEYVRQVFVGEESRPLFGDYACAAMSSAPALAIQKGGDLDSVLTAVSERLRAMHRFAVAAPRSGQDIWFYCACDHSADLVISALVQLRDKELLVALELLKRAGLFRTKG